MPSFLPVARRRFPEVLLGLATAALDKAGSPGRNPSLQLRVSWGASLSLPAVTTGGHIDPHG